MSTTLDFAAAHAVARARLLERAVHDPGPWQIEIDGQRVDAVRVRTPSRVLFLAHFDELSESRLSEVAWLICAGTMISSQDLALSGPPPYAIEWSVGPDVAEPTVVG